jgi:hypothetical protein
VIIIIYKGGYREDFRWFIPKDSRVILVFKVVFLSLLRIRKIFGLIRWPVVIPKTARLVIDFLKH